MTSDPTPTPEQPRCDKIVNNGMGEPTECGRTLPCEYHDPRPEQDEAVRLLTEALGYLDGTRASIYDATRVPMARNRLRDALVLLNATPPPVPAAPTDDGEAVNGSREWWERFAMEQGARAERAEAALESLTERYTVKGHVKVRHGDIEHPANADCRICDALNYSPFVRAGAVPAAPSLDDCPCGHDENEHVHYCSAITEDGESCHCVQEYARLSSPEASSEGGSE